MLQDSDKSAVRELLDVIAAHGVKHIVCSPGSRNAPILMAADARSSFIKHILIDERAAAFVALGIARVSGNPCALICTSGTALLNYAPAVAEAYHQGIPLIVISADRPKEWIDQDDSQTIMQYEALHNIVKGSYDVSDREPGDTPGWYENRIFNDAMLVAMRGKRGPVHINLRLSPPLHTMRPYSSSESCRIITEISSSGNLDKNIIKEMATYLLDKKVMFVAGFLPPASAMVRAAKRFSSHYNVTPMAETIANLHLHPKDSAIDSALCLLNEEERERLAPDVVISIGGALVSRMLKDYLRKCASYPGKRIEHWSVGCQPTTVDCFQGLTRRISADPADFINRLSAEITHQRRLSKQSDSGAFSLGSYHWEWEKVKNIAVSRMQKFALSCEWSDLRAFAYIFEDIPESYNLFLSNGTPVRYAQIIPRRPQHAEFCNRGVSGIEGSTATAVGGALAFSGKSLLISGDMSLCHDLGGLSAALHLDSKLKIIVINNSGGGIFRFVASTSSLDIREEYLCAPPKIQISDLANTFGFDYFKASDPGELSVEISDFLRCPRRAILEVETPPQQSAEILKDALNMKQ